MIFGKYINGGFFSIPNWNTGGELATFDNVLWNTESITRALKKKKVAKQIALAIAKYGRNQWKPDKHENGIEHCYLRNKIIGCCYDIRGEFGNDEDILRYTGVNYNQENIEEFVFQRVEDFKKFLKWVEFEQVKDCFMK